MQFECIIQKSNRKGEDRMNRFSWEIFDLSFIKTGSLIIGFIGGISAPFVEKMYGEGRATMITCLILLTIMDWITAIAAATKEKTYSSEYGINGILRTLFIFLFPAAGNYLDMVFQTEGALFYGITVGLIYHMWQSLTANAVRAGWGKIIPDTVINLVSSEIQAKEARAQKRKEELDTSKNRDK